MSAIYSTSQVYIIKLCRQSREEGIVTFDPALQGECMLFLNILFDSCDNPMLCECASHIGLNANLFCPRCHAGGDKKYKATDEGFHLLFQVRIVRSNGCSVVN